MSSFHHHTPSFPPSDDSFWDVPRLYKDKIHRENGWPVTAVRPLPRRNVDVPESPKRVTLLDYKSKSGTAVPTLESFGTKLSPTASIDMSMSRFSVDGASISGSFHSQKDRPESIAKNLRAKGSRFMRRQNSRFNLRTMEWVEDSNETWTRGNARHNRDQSTGNSIRREISEPYNFQHLTHTHSRHFQQMSRASHHDLISEFSAIRASQAPRRELQGIKAECLQSRALHSEPTSPTRTTLLTPPLSPLRPKQEEPARIPSHQYSQSADYFPQPRPQFYQGRSTTSPIVPPPRRSSRAAVPDFFTHHQEEPVEELDQTPPAPSAPMCSPDRLPATDADDSFAPHAVTTPDNSAFTLKSPPFRVPRPELPDVPEEDDDEKGTATSPSRPSTASSGLRHAMSFPSTKPISQGWSRSPRKVKARDSGSKYSQSEECLSQSEIMLPPLVGEPDDDVPLRPRFSKRVSYKAQGFDACWEDDIDYCYEHAAEADCDFEWDRVSVKDTQDPEDVTTSGAGSITEGYHNCYKTPSPEEISTHHLPRLETSVPSLCSADSAKSSSLSSIAWPATPSCPLPSPRPYGPPSKSSARASANFTFSPPLLVSKDSYSMLHEEAYENIFHKHYHEEPLPLNTLRFDPPSSRDDSPRSSRSPISKCNSHESFMISRSSSLRYPRSTDSMTSLPDLVHSKSSRDVLNLPQEQVFEPAATVKTSDSFVDLQQTPNLTLRQKTSQSLAKEVARQSMLQKAASFGSFDEQEEHEDEQVVILPSVSHHERSQSAAVTQTTEPTYAQRKRSATTATKNRISYSLFPSPPVRTP